MLIFKQLKLSGVLLFMLATSLLSSSLDFIPCDDPRLSQVSKKLTPKEITSKEIQNIIHQMLILSGHEASPEQTGKKAVLVGLAAPQIGVMKQIIIIDPRTLDELRANPGKAEFDILINPAITWQSDELDHSYEGCFSVPEKYLGTPKRPIAIEVEASDREGKTIKKRYEGQAAFVVQHEIDHLKGIRFPERLESETELHLLDNESEITSYRKNWRHWKKHASFKKWTEMKCGKYSE